MRSALCDYEPCAAVCGSYALTYHLQASDQLSTAAALNTFSLGSDGSVAHLPQIWDSPTPHFVDIYGCCVDLWTESPLGLIGLVPVPAILGTNCFLQVRRYTSAHCCKDRFWTTS